MASKKNLHPAVGKYVARYEYDTSDLLTGSEIVDTFDTPEEALAFEMAESAPEDGRVIYVYAVVGVKVVRKPTLTENYNP